MDVSKNKPHIKAPLWTRPFVLLVVGHFLQALGWSSMLLLPLYVKHLGATETQLGMVMAASSVGGLLLRPWWKRQSLQAKLTSAAC